MAEVVRRRRPRVAGILRVQCPVRVQRPVLAGRFLVDEVEVGSQHGEHNGRHVAVSLLWIGAAIAFGLVAVWTSSMTCRRCLVVDDLRRCLYVRRVCDVSLGLELALEGRGLRGLCGS